VSDFSVLKYCYLNINYLVNILNYIFYSTAVSSPKPITTCCSVLLPEIVMHDAYIVSFRQTKITRKASDAA